MKKVLLLLFILVTALTVSTTSYAEKKGISLSKSNDIKQLIDLVLTDAFIETWVNGFTQSYKGVASAARTMEEKEKISMIMETVKTVITDEFPNLKKQYIPIYDEYFTQDEIKQLLAFYKKPIGEKSIKFLPVITQRGMELGKRWGASLVPIMTADLKKKGIVLEPK